MSGERKIPEGRASRFLRLASLGARTGASLLLARDGEGAAERAAEVLGTMRGLAAKIGQMASYVDGVVPDEHRASFEKALGGLRTAAPTSSPAAIARIVEEELGAPVTELFASWDAAPFASASIGQVHRATLHDGREVAVKVQHPGIQRAIESDLGNAGMLERMIGAVGGEKLDSKRIFAEVRERFMEELDYGLEARRQQAFRALFAGDATIRVPDVVLDRSARRVLTSELVAGKTLEEAATEGPEARAAYCRTLWRFVFKGNLVGGMFNADPHPGNYLFQGDGQIAFLDFGCVQPIEGDRLALACVLHEAALRGDEPGFERAAAIILETRGGRYEELAIAFSRHCFEPIFASPFRVTRAYTAGLTERIGQMKQEILFKDASFVPLPPGMIFMNRLQFGFYSVLARLDAEVDYAEVERAFTG